MSIFSDLVEEGIEIFMDDFSVYGSSFDNFLENIDYTSEMPRQKLSS